MGVFLFIALVVMVSAVLPVVCGATWLALESGRSLRLSRAGASWFFRESAANIIVVATIAIGWWPTSPQRKRRQRDLAETPRTDRERLPVLLVHGYGLNRGCFTFLQTYLHTRGYEWVWAINNRPNSSPIPVFAKRLGRAIERLKDETGAERVDVVAHSMGGVIAAYALKEFGYARHVRRLVTVGTSWAGTKTHVFGLRREAHDLSESSAVIDALRTYSGDTVAIWSRSDHLVLPSESACPSHARCIELHDLGHQEMLMSARVFRCIADALLAPGQEE
ncbi:MAG: alpha/beta fold hydrolase [Myxococcota bacterium]|nr:alpha/beta fold hydrolase [Myxococcota bacterium]